MAKVIRGARRVSKNDKEKAYGVYTSSGRLIRRAIHPEFYMHSWSQKVKKNRELFAKVMENYSKMDIVTKQAYTEAIFLNPKLPLNIITRKIISNIKTSIKRGKPPGPPGLPSWVPNPWPTPTPIATPNPYISPEPWPYQDWQPWPRESGIGGHEQALRDGIAQGNQRRPDRTPLPGDLPFPQPTRDNQHNPYRQPIIITVEIDPEGLEGKAYEVWLSLKSEYSEIKRIISSHKREVIILVVFGTLVLFGYGLIAGGAELISGTELLVTPEASSLYALTGLMFPNLVVKHIERWYYKRLAVKALESLNIYAINLSKGWPCYSIREEIEDGYNLMFLTGFDAEHAGTIAGGVTVTFDWDNGQANIEATCYNPPDTVEIFLGADPLKVCGPMNIDLVPPVLFNETKQVFGSWRKEVGKNYIRYRFEDRPGFGDYDYNDAYFTIYLDDKGNIVGWVAEEGQHCDELSIWWNGIKWAHYPKRC